MNPAPAPPSPTRLESPSGLSIELNANGSLRRLDHGDILLNLFPGNEIEGGPANLYLRRVGDTVEAIPLLGPRSPARFAANAKGATWAGDWRGIRFAVVLTLAESAAAWFWHVMLENTGAAAVTVDLIHAQDLGLAAYGAVRLNEYYVSQYLDHTPLAHPERGWVLASRQNQSTEGRNPWCVIGALGRGTSFATDALQVHGLATRAGHPPAGLTAGLPGTRRQHEHAMAAIQDEAVRLQPGARTERGFFGWFEADHPAATSDADLAFVDRALALPEAGPPAEWPSPADEPPACASLFSTAPLLESLDLSEAEIDHLFGMERRHDEREAGGRLLSFFTGDRRHVVLKAKELQVLRPHGHMLRSGSGLTPDECGLTSTVWMAGVFHSMVTQGHVSINRFLSTTHSYLSLFRSHGQRLLVQLHDGWQLLDVPSAFEMTPEGCRWIYRHGEGMIEVRSRALTERHELTLEIEVLAGGPLRFLLSNHIALNGDDGSEPGPVRFDRDGMGAFVRASPESDVGRRYPDGGFRLMPFPGTVVEQLGGDELLFADGSSRGQPFLCFVTAPAQSLGFSIRGGLGHASQGETADDFWRAMTAGLRLAPPAGSGLAGEAERVVEILPWFVHDALIHYLSPRGLEQYSGGGWGTRDVTQGPVELLLALGRPEPIREILVRVFRNQNPDGDWPQWFMFFDRVRDIRAGDSHGDIVFWPLLALAQYLLASDDAALLDETLPYFDPEGDAQAECATVWQHVERALAVIDARMIAGTRLAAYGHGDWNDSLQPADPSFRDHLCSAWTVTLHYQTLTTLAEAMRRLGRDQQAIRFEQWAAEVLADFQRLLVVDGTVAGYAHFDEAGGVQYLLHPDDRTTGLSYSLLPMIHADPERNVQPRAGAPPSRLDRDTPARPRRRPAVRPAHGVPRRSAAILPAGGEQQLLRPRDRSDVYARTPPIRRSAVALRRRRRLLPRLVPGGPHRPRRACPRGDTAPSQLLLLQQRRRFRRPLSGLCGIRTRARRRHPARRRLAGLFQRRWHRHGTDLPLLPRAARGKITARDRPRDPPRPGRPHGRAGTGRHPLRDHLPRRGQGMWRPGAGAQRP